MNRLFVVSGNPPRARRIVRPFSAFLLFGLCPVIGLAYAPLRAPSPVNVCCIIRRHERV
jgi:hypothetical protein